MIAAAAAVRARGQFYTRGGSVGFSADGREYLFGAERASGFIFNFVDAGAREYINIKGRESRRRCGWGAVVF